MPKKNSFMKQLIYMAVLIVIPVSIVLLLNFQTEKIVERLCMDNYISSLEETRNKMDEQFRALDNHAVDMMLNKNIGIMLSATSPKEASESVYPLYNYGQMLKKSVYAGGAFCREYQIISRANELIYRNNSFVSGLEFFFNKSSNYPEMTYGQWHDLLFQHDGRFLIPAQTVILDSSPYNAVTYVFPLNYGPSLQKSDATVLYIIETKNLMDIMQNANSSNSATMHILSSTGDVIFSTGISQDGEFSDKELLLSTDNSGENKGFFETSDSGSLLAFTKSPYNGLIYAAQVPKSVVFAQMYTVSSTTRVALLIYLAISIVLAVLFAYQMSKPIRKIVDNLMLFMPEDGPDTKHLGEFDFITENMLRLLKRNKTLELSDKDKSAALADIALNRLLSGHAKSSDLSLDMLEELRFPSGWERCCVVALKNPTAAVTPGGGFPIFDIESAARTLPVSSAEICRHIHATTETVVAAVYVFQSSDKQHNLKLLEQDIYEMDRRIFEEAGAHPYIGVGRLYDDIYDAYFSYDQALYAADLASYSDHNQVPCISNYDDVMRASGIYFYPIDLEYRLVNCAKAGEVLETLSVFEKIIDENFNMRTLTQRMQRQLCYDIRATLLKTCDELRLDVGFSEAIAEEIDKRAEPEAIVKIIRDAFGEIASDISNKKRSHNTGLKERILLFIEEHYSDSQMCVAMVAEEFGLSESYFSQFFKMQTGEVFSAHLEKLRIERAEQLISADSSIEIESLYRMVGYNSSNTFRRAFKRVVGVSPSSYKQR